MINMEASKPNLPFKSTVMAQPKTAEDIEAIYGECDLGPLLELPSIRFLDIYPPFPPDFRNYNPTDDPRAGTKKFMLADFIVKILYKWDPNAVKAFMDFSKPFVWVRQEKNEIFRHTYVGRDDNKVIDDGYWEPFAGYERHENTKSESMVKATGRKFAEAIVCQRKWKPYATDIWFIAEKVLRC